VATAYVNTYSLRRIKQGAGWGQDLRMFVIRHRAGF